MLADRTETERLFHRLLAVRTDAVAAGELRRDTLAAIPPPVREGAENLVHYLAIRGVDLRREQLALAELGLSSLGRAEAHVLATVDAVLARLAADLVALGGVPLADGIVPTDLSTVGPVASAGRQALERHTAEAFGPPPQGRRTRVMVTLPTEAGTDASIVDRFVAAGMSVAQINAAHDDPATWSAMAANVRRAGERHGSEVRIVVDLPGPKLRTGPIAPGPAVVKIRPDRDDYGRVIRPGHLVLRRDDVKAGREAPPPCGTDDEPTDIGDETAVVVAGWDVTEAAPGDRIKVDDARGRRRLLTVVESRPDGVLVSSDRTVYLVPGLDLVHLRAATRIGDGRVVRVPRGPGSIHLVAGDVLELRLDGVPMLRRLSVAASAWDAEGRPGVADLGT